MKRTFRLLQRPFPALALLATLGAAVAVPAHAEVVISPTVSNGGFETPTITAPGGFQYSPAGATWTFNPAGGSGIVHPPSGFGSTPPAGGSQYGFLQGSPGGSSQVGGYFYQAVTLNAGEVYNYSFSYAGRSAAADGSFGGLTTNVLDVTGVGGFGSAPPTAASFFTPVSFSTTSGMPFATLSGSFTPTTTGTYDFGFENTTRAGDNTSFIDNVTLSGSASAAPEPAQFATLGFFGLGLGGLLLRARKPTQSAA